MAPWPFGDLKMFGYDLIMVDPPWPFDLWSSAGNEKSPAAQYDCMTLDAIKDLPVGQLLRAGGVCVLWCTWPLVAAGVHAETLKAWGLEPKTGGDWAKRTRHGRLRWGTGYLLRSVCEPFIIATIGTERDYRGGSACNLIETAGGRLLDGLAREHSRKPEAMYGLLEKVMPDAWRADVFSRQRRLGWDSWGNEVDKFSPTSPANPGTVDTTAAGTPTSSSTESATK